MLIRAILFDLDGVLIETRMIHFESFNKALTSHGFDALTWKEHEHEFDGLPTKEKLKILVKRRRVFEEDVDSIKALKQKETITLLKERVKFSPAMYCLWAGLQERGLKVGVVTNAIRDTANFILHRMVLDPQVLVTNEDCKPKPSPEPFIQAARWFSIPLLPQECIAVEDGKYGITSAKEAGCKVMEVKGPSEVTAEAIWRIIEEKP